jgi:hypothetical protein
VSSNHILLQKDVNDFNADWIFGLSINFDSEVFEVEDFGYVSELFMRPVQVCLL